MNDVEDAVLKVKSLLEFVPTHKTCSGCGMSKTLDLFHKHLKGLFGLRSKCKECRKTGGQQYYQKNRERCLVVRRNWKDKNRDRRLEYNREYHQSNKEKRAEYAQKYHLATKDRRNPYIQEWKNNHPGCRTVYENKRKTCKSGAGGSFSLQDVNNMFVAQNGQCVLCKDLLVKVSGHRGKTQRFHIDHIIPICKGGTSGTENLQLLCPKCNRQKGRKILPLTTNNS